MERLGDDKCVRCGTMWTHNPHDKSVELTQHHYIRDAVQAIDAPVERRRDKGQTMTSSELSAFQGVSGALQWVVVQTSPVHQVDVSFLQSDAKTAKVESLLKAHKVVHNVKDNDADVLRYMPCVEELFDVGWSDASWGNCPDGSSTGGHTIGLAARRIVVGHRTPVGLVSWTIHKLKTVSGSSPNNKQQSNDERTTYIRWMKSLRRAFTPPYWNAGRRFWNRRALTSNGWCHSQGACEGEPVAVCMYVCPEKPTGSKGDNRGINFNGHV